jgi:hypothetical protein
MVRFGERHSRDWHEKIRATAHFECQVVLASGILNPDFPWDQLRRHTESYLKKKGKIVQGELDKRLQNLIKNHGVLHVSVAACARVMSPEAIRLLLADELKSATSDSPNLPPFLQAIVATHHENPMAITEEDSKLAQALTWCFASYSASVGQKLETLIKLVIAGIPSYSFAYSHVRRLVEKYSTDLSSQIQVLQDSSLWVKARGETEWLSGLLDQSCSTGYLEAIPFLDKGFPTWKVWAEWAQSDTKLAQALVQFPPSGVSSPGRNLEYLVGAQMGINPRKSSFVYLHVCEMTRKSSADLARQVEELKASGHWLAAHNETEWLAILLDRSNGPTLGEAEAIKMLESEFSQWRAWAEWTEQDSQLAQALIPCQTPDPAATGQCLKILFKSLIAGVSIRSLLHTYLHKLARQFFRTLALKLETLSVDGHFVQGKQRGRMSLYAS